MRKFKISILVILVILCLGCIGTGAFSADNKVAKMYRDVNTTFMRWVKMQVTYSFSVWDRLWNNDNAFVLVHLGNNPDTQYYNQVSPYESYINTQSITFNKTYDLNLGYYTYGYQTYYSGVGSTKHITIRTAVYYSYIDNTYSTCTYFYGNANGEREGSFSVKIQNSDTLKPSDFNVIR